MPLRRRTSAVILSSSSVGVGVGVGGLQAAAQELHETSIEASGLRISWARTGGHLAQGGQPVLQSLLLFLVLDLGQVLEEHRRAVRLA